MLDTKTYGIYKKIFLIFLLFIFIQLIIYFSKRKNNFERISNKDNNLYFISKFTEKITTIFLKTGAVNLNEVEGQINSKKKWKPINNKSNEMNIGIHLDPNFILPTMITLASIMDTQNKNTLIRFHIAVVLNFTASDMIKIYTLRNLIREETEFNFYNASKVERDLEGLNI